MIKKKPHWSHTTAGKKHMAKMRRASVLQRKRAKKGVTKNVNQQPSPQGASAHAQEQLPTHVIAFAAGHILCWLEAHARSHRVSAAALTYRLGKILQSQASG